MERIGLAASKMAKGNFLLYNLWVVIISSVVSVFLFLLAAISIFLSLVILSAVVKGIMPIEFEKSWQSMLRICMLALTIVVSLFNLFAIFKNIRFRKPSD